MTEAGKNVIVDFSEKNILENVPYVLPPKRAIIRFSEVAAGVTPEVLDSLARLKTEGYSLAVAGFSGNPAHASLYLLAEIIAIAVDTDRPDSIAATIEAARSYRVPLLAMRVQDAAQFKAFGALGFSLFQGAFYKSPEQIRVRKLTSNEAVRFNLLREIEDSGFDSGRLSAALRSDVTLSLRLLAYLDSAAFAFSEKVKSVSHAINLLGLRQVTNWLRVVLLLDMAQSKEAHEIVLLSAQRGAFLEHVAKEHDFWGFAPESVHLLGLFSLLDALMSMPMTDIVAHLPLDHKMKAALCRDANSEYVPLLQLAQCFEEARWNDGAKLVCELNLDSKKVHKAFQMSIDWVSRLSQASFTR
jgi:EAL and modified HD-GYP domain-containing signal transduction protein